MSAASPSPAPAVASDLAKQTLRHVAILVGACVVFVGSLSVAAVAITSRAVAVHPAEPSSTPAADPTPPKKPLSI